MKTTTTKCGKCDGRGTLSWTRNANGVCFWCNGAGVLLVDSETVAARLVPRAESIAKIAQWLRDAAATDAYDLGEDWNMSARSRIVWALAHSQEDVAVRGLAAAEKAFARSNNPELDVKCLRRDYATERAIVLSGSRKHVTNVRKAG